MMGKFWDRWQCRSIAPLLVPFCESVLDERTRTRVLAHLDRCDACRNELAEIAAMGDFFRANPPMPAAPQVDLWARLEARIEADARPTSAPQWRPAPVAPAMQWGSFLVSFSQTGVVVAAAVTISLLVIDKSGWRLTPAPSAGQDTKIAARSDNGDNGIHLVLRPASPVPHQAKKADVRVAENRAAGRREASPERNVSVAERPRLVAEVTKAHRAPHFISVTPVTPVTPRRSSEVVAARTAVPSPAEMVSRTDGNEVFDHLTAKSAETGLRQVAEAGRETESKATFFAHASDVSLARDERPKRDLIQPAAWVAAENEEVGADAAVETATALHRQQTLFSYGGR